MYFQIRYATLSDIPAMYAISLRAHQMSYADLIPSEHRVRFKERYTFSAKSKELYGVLMSPRIKDPLWYVWVAELNKKVVGYILAQKISETLMQSRGLFVDPACYGCGIGSALLRTSMGAADENTTIRLLVVENNDRAKRIYARHGFSHVAYDKKTYFGAKQEVMEYSPVDAAE